jgi:hypothetical protein
MNPRQKPLLTLLRNDASRHLSLGSNTLSFLPPPQSDEVRTAYREYEKLLSTRDIRKVSSADSHIDPETVVDVDPSHGHLNDAWILSDLVRSAADVTLRYLSNPSGDKSMINRVMGLEAHAIIDFTLTATDAMVTGLAKWEAKHSGGTDNLENGLTRFTCQSNNTEINELAQLKRELHVYSRATHTNELAQAVISFMQVAEDLAKPTDRITTAANYRSLYTSNIREYTRRRATSQSRSDYFDGIAGLSADIVRRLGSLWDFDAERVLSSAVTGGLGRLNTLESFGELKQRFVTRPLGAKTNIDPVATEEMTKLDDKTSATKNKKRKNKKKPKGQDTAATSKEEPLISVAQSSIPSPAKSAKKSSQAEPKRKLPISRREGKMPVNQITLPTEVAIESYDEDTEMAFDDSLRTNPFAPLIEGYTARFAEHDKEEQDRATAFQERWAKRADTSKLETDTETSRVRRRPPPGWRPPIGYEIAQRRLNGEARTRRLADREASRQASLRLQISELDTYRTSTLQSSQTGTDLKDVKAKRTEVLEMKAAGSEPHMLQAPLSDFVRDGAKSYRAMRQAWLQEARSRDLPVTSLMQEEVGSLWRTPDTSKPSVGVLDYDGPIQIASRRPSLPVIHPCSSLSGGVAMAPHRDQGEDEEVPLRDASQLVGADSLGTVRRSLSDSDLWLYSNE